MRSPLRPSAPHPMMLTAAVAVILFCGVGTAAVMGWLPSSSGGNPATAAAPAAPAPAATTAITAPAPQEPPALTRTAPPPPVAAVCHACGTVQAIHEYTTRARGSGVGAAGGALLGGLLGNQLGGGHGRQLATVAGAIGGAVAGNQVEGTMNAHHHYEIVVRMEDGRRRTLRQSAPPAVHEGEAVRIVDGQLRANG